MHPPALVAVGTMLCVACLSALHRNDPRGGGHRMTLEVGAIGPWLLHESEPERYRFEDRFLSWPAALAVGAFACFLGPGRGVAGPASRPGESDTLEAPVGRCSS